MTQLGTLNLPHKFFPNSVRPNFPNCRVTSPTLELSACVVGYLNLKSNLLLKQTLKQENNSQCEIPTDTTASLAFNFQKTFHSCKMNMDQVTVRHSQTDYICSQSGVIKTQQRALDSPISMEPWTHIKSLNHSVTVSQRHNVTHLESKDHHHISSIQILVCQPILQVYIRIMNQGRGPHPGPPKKC